MTKFDLDEIEILKFVFSQFTLDDLAPSTYQTYKIIIEEYLDTAILGKVDSDDYTKLEEKQTLSDLPCLNFLNH